VVAQSRSVRNPHLSPSRILRAMFHSSIVLLIVPKVETRETVQRTSRPTMEFTRFMAPRVGIRARLLNRIGRPTSSVAQANLTIKINFNILPSFSSSDILTFYLHAFLQSLHPFEKNCAQGLPCDFCKNSPNTNKKLRWSFSAISHQLSFDVAQKEKVRRYQIWQIGELGVCFIRLRPM
jgi:hypothetical protein